MKTKNLYLSIVLIITTIFLTAGTANAQRFADVIGNPPYGSDPVRGVLGSGATPGNSTNATFNNDIQNKVNAAGATLTVASTSGSQSVNGNTIEVEAATAETVLAVINSPKNSNTPASNALIAALGGGSAAQQLAESMQGLRNGDGSIDPVILTGSVSSYNNYVRSLIDSSQVTQKPSSELDGFIQRLPAGQKAVQVVLGKLLEATKGS
jgi:hypothetical protein